MLMTARKASQALVRDGVSLWSANAVLKAGLAGEPERTETSVLYDADRVRDLAQRPTVSWTQLEGLCPAGFFVSRRNCPATGSREEQVAALSDGWGSVCPWRWVVMDIQRSLGADIVETRGFSHMVLEPPGPWFEPMEGCWFPTGRGRPWVLHVGPPCPEKIAG